MKTTNNLQPPPSHPSYIQMLGNLITNQINDLTDLREKLPGTTKEQQTELAQAIFRAKQYREELRYLHMTSSGLNQLIETYRLTGGK